MNEKNCKLLTCLIEILNEDFYWINIIRVLCVPRGKLKNFQRGNYKTFKVIK